jgi:hypothetical protein
MDREKKPILSFRTYFLVKNHGKYGALDEKRTPFTAPNLTIIIMNVCADYSSLRILIASVVEF